MEIKLDRLFDNFRLEWRPSPFSLAVSPNVCVASEWKLLRLLANNPTWILPISKIPSSHHSVYFQEVIHYLVTAAGNIS